MVLDQADDVAAIGSRPPRWAETGERFSAIDVPNLTAHRSSLTPRVRPPPYFLAVSFAFEDRSDLTFNATDIKNWVLGDVAKHPIPVQRRTRSESRWWVHTHLLTLVCLPENVGNLIDVRHELLANCRVH